MNLVKWLRKNNRKMMAVFVVLIMISFVLGAALQQLSRRIGFKDNAVWLFGDDGQINRSELSTAEKQLDVVRALGISDNVLLARDPNTGQITQRNLSPILLYQLMYPNSTESSQLSQIAKMFIRQNQLGIGESVVDQFFSQTRQNQNLNWILLTKEAKKHGITVLSAQIKDMLDNAGIGDRLSAISSNLGISKDDVYRAIADFFEVRAYLGIITAGDDTTTNQIRNVFKGQTETFNADFVSIEAESFAKDMPEPSEEKIVEFFEKYKSQTEGMISQDNPFGFGYKLPDRVAVEYIILDGEQINKIVPEITEAQTEQFYQENISMFVENVRKDPKDANSPMVQQTIAYPRVAARLKQQLWQNKISAKAEEIMNDIKDTADAAFADIDPEKMTSKALQSAAADYSNVSKLAMDKFNITLDYGKTSLLSAGQFASISELGSFALMTSQKTPIPLTKLVFSVDGFDTNVLPFDAQKPMLYENIGMLANRYGGKYAVARVIEIAKSQTPESIDTVIEIKTPLSQSAADANSYTIRSKVVDDMKLQSAMEEASKIAVNFVNQAKDANDWAVLIDKFNEMYPAKDKTEKTFKADNWSNQRRILATDIENAKAIAQSQPGAEAVISQSLAMQSMIEQLYSHFEDGKDTVSSVPFVVEFKPQGQVVIIKSMARKQPDDAQYQETKSELALGLDARTAQGATFAMLLPDNLKHRMNLRFAKEQEQQTDSNSPN